MGTKIKHKKLSALKRGGLRQWLSFSLHKTITPQFNYLATFNHLIVNWNAVILTNIQFVCCLPHIFLFHTPHWTSNGCHQKRKHWLSAHFSSLPSFEWHTQNIHSGSWKGDKSLKAQPNNSMRVLFLAVVFLKTRCADGVRYDKSCLIFSRRTCGEILSLYNTNIPNSLKSWIFCC